MDLKTKINTGLKQAMRDKDAARLATLRLIMAAIKDREIALRGEGRDTGLEDAEITGILAKMVKQRQESARTYEEGGRLDLAERELSEISVIEEFLPRPLEQTEIDAAIAKAMEDVGAASIRDMGKVMGALKASYAGQMDFGAVGPMVKDRLCAGA
ncbi:MAG: GatB/YqeY domain-containing protein [Marinovum sp.]|nr:GatB/YqeY domain-containing protein [Marinovum sp.]